jgi:outer membrane protein OmpA-like peptidoglycan-associated protein
MTLFAQWTAVASTTFKVTLNSNGGSGTVASLSGIAGALVTVPSQSGLIRSGFTMTSWNTESSGRGDSYPIGSVISMTKSFTLFAQWKGHQPTSLFGAIGTFPKNSSVLSAVLKSQVERLALTVRSRRYSKVDLFGYTATTGLASLNLSLSRARAQHVASYMRSRLFALRVKGVSISFVGEGAIDGESDSLYSRVEAFGV